MTQHPKATAVWTPTLVLTAGAMLLSAAAAQAVYVDTPVTQCGATMSGTTIEIDICGGTDTIKAGAPAGFSIQWMTEEDFLSTGVWPDSGCIPGVDPGCPASFCKASFSGVPCTKKTGCTNRFSLGPGECTLVEIGDLFDEELGLSSSCFDDLVCGTKHVFRAFAHAYKLRKRSAFTSDLVCATSSCTPDLGCTLTQGFWKAHDGSGPQPNAWPDLPETCADSDPGLGLGNVCYDKAELVAIFNKPAQGNGLIALAHQLIAAKLNILNGADGSAINAGGGPLAQADSLIGNLVVPPVGAGYLKPSATSSLTETLDNYNSGTIGPGHCEDQEPLN